MKFQLRDYQQEASDKAIGFFNDDDNRNGIIIAPTGCHAKGQEILMYDGSLKKVEDIRVGDTLMGDGSTPRKVLSLARGRDKMYKVIPYRGKPFIVNERHILSLKKKGRGILMGDYVEMPLGSYLKRSDAFKRAYRLYKPDKVVFPSEGGKMVEPYFLGLFLGDGCSVSGTKITTMHKEVRDYIYEFADKYGFKIHEDSRGNGKACSYYFAHHEKFNPLRRWLASLELCESRSGDKFIPLEYKTASYNDRLLLLAGLVDTDCFYSGTCYEYTTKSKRLAEDVAFLCRSLGFMCNIGALKWVKGNPYYRMRIVGDLDKIPNRVAKRKGGKKGRCDIYTTGFDVEYIGEDEYYGFTLDGNHLYLDGQFFVHHNCGKSLIIADVASKLDEPLLVFQPSKEILEQNHEKLKSYNIDASIYSASCGKKEVGKITLATIGSVKNNPELFDSFKYIMVDEAHLANPEEGMYKDFFSRTKRKILGLTATPYRLSGFRIKRKNDYGYFDYENKAVLEFLTTMKGKLFERVVCNIPSKRLIERGYLCKPRYFNLKVMDNSLLKKNTQGTNFSEESVRRAMESINFKQCLVNIVERLQHPKSGIKRNGIIVFASFIEECEYVASMLPNCAVVTGSTPKKERKRILEEFKSGNIEVVLNVGVLVTGFDYPALDTVVLASPTMSLARYYQEIGRVVRPFEGKEAWVVDMVSNFDTFGKVEDLFFFSPDGKPMVCGVIDGKNKKLTNRPL